MYSPCCGGSARRRCNPQLQLIVPLRRSPEAILSFLSPCHGGYICRKHSGNGFPGWILPNSLFSGRAPEFPPTPMRRALPFLPKRKGSKRFASLRGLTAKDSTQRSSVKRGLRLWKQQPKQSPPFRNLSPPHQQTAALQLLEVTPIRQAVPLLNDSESCIFPFRQRERTGNAAHSMRSQAAR